MKKEKSKDKDKDWIFDYYSKLTKSLNNKNLSENLIRFKDIVLKVKDNGGKIIFAGNGASNTIATHAHLDFMNQLGISTMVVNDGSYLTAASNDFGYENVFKRFIDINANENDLVVLISSSGKSPNIINACIGSRFKKCDIVTFSGFEKNNHLRTLGDINFWVDSNIYNIVESIHNSWLVSVVDLIIKDNPSVVGIHGIEFDVKGIDNNEL